MDNPGVVDAGGGVQAVADAGVEVVYAVGGRGVDCAGALVGGDVVGVDAEDGAVEERMLEVARSRRSPGKRASTIGSPSLQAVATEAARSAATM
jgi:hypothetical protein